MKQTRRTIAAITVVAILLAQAGAAFAGFPDVAGSRFAAATTRLLQLGIIVGDPDGNFYPNRDVTRAEMVKMIISAKGLLHQVTPLTGSAAFPDTPSHWASGFIALAKSLGIIEGFPDGTFRPQDNVTYVQAAKMLLEASGNGPNPSLAWPDNYMSVALARGMFQGVPTTAANVPAIRGDCAMMTARTIDTIASPLTGHTLAQAVFGSVASLQLTPATTTYTPAGAAVQFAALPKNALGQTLVGLPVGWMTSSPSNAAITQNGLFNSPVPGTYTVTVAAGGFVQTVVVGVYGTATALRATPSTTQVSATGTTKVTIAVEVVDNAGSRVATNSSAIVTMAHATSNGAVTLGDTAKTVANGVATFEVISTTNDDRTDTIEFTAAGLTKASVSISTVTQIATSIELRAEPAAIQANSITSTEVTARVLDQSGAQMTSGVIPLTFSIAGPGTFVGGSRTSVEAVTATGEASVQVYSEQAVPGTILVTVASAGLPNSLLSISSYLAGTATTIRAEVTDASLQACSTGPDADVATLSIELLDGAGNPTSKTSGVNLAVTLADGSALATKGLAVSGDLLINAGDTETGSIVVGAAAANLGVAGPQTIKITPSDTSLAPVTVNLAVLAGDPAQLVVSHPDSVALPVLNPTAVVSVQVRDAADNNVPTAGLSIAAGWNDPGDPNQGKPTINGTLNPPANPSATGAAKAVTDGSGLASFTFSAQAYVKDSYELRFAHESLSATSGVLTLVDAVASQLEMRFAGVGGATITQLRADHSQLGFLEVTVKDGQGNPLPDWDVTIAFPNDGGNVQDVAVELGTVIDPYADGEITLRTVNSPGDTVHGMVAVALKGGVAATAFNVTATAHGLAVPLTRTASFRVIKGNAVAGVVVRTEAGGDTSELDVTGNVAYGLRLVPVDNGGNTITAPVDVTVLVDHIQGLFSTGVNGQFRASPTGTSIPEGSVLTIARGQSSKAVYYVQPTDQEDVEIGVDAGTAAYTAYQFDAASTEYAAGPPETNTVTFTVSDGSGNPAPGLKIEFHASTGSLSASTAVTDAAGSVSVVWADGAGGSLVATALDAVLGDGSVLSQGVAWSAP